MATESQITKFALFATNNCVQPEEKEEYENFSTALWSTLAPADPVIYPAYLPTQTAIGRRPNVRPGRHAPRQSRPRQNADSPQKSPATVLQVEPNPTRFLSPPPNPPSANPSTPPQPDVVPPFTI
jgi:hypothetical protein